MTVPYATPDDVYARALTARAFVVVPRALDGAAGDMLEIASSTFWMLGHGLSADDAVRLVPIARGALPAPATATSIYSPLVLDSWRFRLALLGGSSASTFVDAGKINEQGSSSWGVLVDFERRLRACLLAESADVDQCLTGHATPLLVDPVTGKYPEKVIDVVSIGAALRAVTGLVFENTQAKAALDRLEAKGKDVAALKEIWRSGVAINPTPRDQTDGVPDNGARAINRLTSGADPWCAIVRGTL